MNAQEQAAEDLRQVSLKLKKIGGETSTLLQKIQALEDAAANNAGGISDELQAAINDVKEQAQVVDDAVPDAPPVTEEQPPAEEQPPVES